MPDRISERNKMVSGRCCEHNSYFSACAYYHRLHYHALSMCLGMHLIHGPKLISDHASMVTCQ